MNFKVNQGPYETVVLETTYSIDEQIESEVKHRCYAWRHHEQGTLVPELIFRHNVWPELIAICICILVSIVSLIIALDTGFFPNDTSGSHKYTHYYFLGTSLFVIWSSTALAIKNFADLRYFVFKGDSVIFQSKVFGRRIYRTKDLKFHLLKIRQYNHRYHLEVELPDLSIPEHKRLIILETTASKITMDGVLAVLFPLLRGDNAPYVNATPRRIQPIPVGDYVSFGRNIDNLETHLHVWFLNYKVNELIFWLVHISREKLMEKELKRSEFGGTLL